VKTIGEDAFSDVSGLTKIICVGSTPPKAGKSDVDDATCLYVPQGSVGAYSKADYWKNFKCINEITE